MHLIHFLYPPPYSQGLPLTASLAEDVLFRVGYVMYPTLWGIALPQFVLFYY